MLFLHCEFGSLTTTQRWLGRCVATVLSWIVGVRFRAEAKTMLTRFGHAMKVSALAFRK